MADPNGDGGVPPTTNGVPAPATAASAPATTATAPADGQAGQTAQTAQSARHAALTAALSAYGASSAALGYTPAPNYGLSGPPGARSVGTSITNLNLAPSTSIPAAPPLSAQQGSAKRRRVDPGHTMVLDELMRSAREDPDDLWALAVQKAEASQQLADKEIANARIIRNTVRGQRAGAIRARDAANNRWMIDNQIIPKPAPGSTMPVAGTPVGALNNTATPAGAAAAATAPGVVFPPNYELPSAGPAFDPPIRPMGTFLEEVRCDMITPMRSETVAVRGFLNPGALCYRNAVLTALLNTDRFLSFLHAHARRTITLMDIDEVSHHLLTRLYHLAQAYWSHTGYHPMTRDATDSFEKLVTMFWRSCKYNVDGSELGEIDMQQYAALKQLPDVGPHPWHTTSWVQVCRDGADGDDGGMGGTSCMDLTFRQQDAAEFLDWLVEFSATQLYVAPDRYAAAKSSDYYDCMFRTYITSRYVCGSCLRPVRLRSAKVDRESSIKLNVATRFPSEPAQAPAYNSPFAGRSRKTRRVFTLQDYLGQYFNEDLPDRKCERCKNKPTPVKPMRRIRRMQTAPEILNVHLMRTELDLATLQQHKNQDVVDAPEFLDVTKWLEPHTYTPGSQVFYRLTAVVSHRGDDAHSGHYVSYVRTGTGSTGGPPASAAKHSYEDVRRVMRETRDVKTRVREGYHAVADYLAQQMMVNGVPPDARVASMHYRVVEAQDSAWSCINDEQVTHGIPFARIINTTPDETHNADAADWFDPVVLVYEKWVEKHVTDKQTGKRVYRVPMNLPNMTQNHLHLRSLTRTAATEQQIRATAVGDVMVPEQWPPSHITAPLPEIYREGRGDYGIDADQLGIVDLGEDSDSDGGGGGDGDDDDGDGGDGGPPKKKAKTAKTPRTRNQALRYMEEFFGWGDYDPEVAARAQAAEKKTTAQLTAAAKKARDMHKRVRELTSSVARDFGAKNGAKKKRIIIVKRTPAAAAATIPGSALTAAPASASVVPATNPLVPAPNGDGKDGKDKDKDKDKDQNKDNGPVRGGRPARHQQLRMQRRRNHNLFSPYSPYSTAQVVRPSAKKSKRHSDDAVQETEAPEGQGGQGQARQPKSRLGSLLGYLWK